VSVGANTRLYAGMHLYLCKHACNRTCLPETVFALFWTVAVE